MKSLKKRVDLARELGKEAFENGAKCIPAHDPSVMSLMIGLAVGSGAVEILESWIGAWTRANLSEEY